MATPDEIARTYQRQQKSIIAAVIAAVLGLWKRLDEHNLTRSWQTGIGPQMVEAVMQAQLAAAAAAPAYLEELAAAQDVLADMGALVPTALSGVASDGRPLESLLYQPIILLKRLLAAGKQPEEAMRQATTFMALIASTQVADAGRGAVNVGITATREWVTYIRVVNLPACSRCIILAGREYSWSTGFQRHPNCFPAGTTVSGPANRAATRRWYEGELAVITTASGQELAATGNHPILTDRGWVPANLLQPGDYVVRSLLGEGAVPLIVPDERQVPARIEDLWARFGPELESTVPVSSQDFHGDGLEGSYARVRSSSSCNACAKSGRWTTCAHRPYSWESGDLGTYRQTGPTLSRAGSALDPSATQLPIRWLPSRRRTIVPSSGDSFPGGPFGAFGTSLSGSLSCAPVELLDALALARLSGRGGALDIHAEALGGARFASGELPHRQKRDGLSRSTHHRDLGADISPDVYRIGDTYLHNTIAIGANSGLRWDATDGPEDDRIGRDLLKSLGPQVELDQVIGAVKKQWSGYVYNLTSSEGWYAANGLVVSNCDCTMLPIGPDSDRSSILAPDELFAAMSQADQDRRFGKAGAEALRLGADMGQVVNARRGMRTAAGGRLITTEGTTVRGAAGKQLGNLRKVAGERYRRSQIVRPMPEQLLADADGDRDLAIQFLQRFGYLDAGSARRRARAADSTAT